MSPISREHRRGGRRFVVVSIALISGLALAGTLMAAAALARGPQVRAVVGDTASAVAQRDITVTLRTDQPLDPSSVQGVALEPSAPLQVDVVGASLRVRFTDTLAFATDYRLTVPSLRGQTTGTVSTAAYEFTTPPLTITTLVRAGAFDRLDGEDAVVRHDLSRGTETTVLSAPRIQEYAEAGGDAVAVALDHEGTASLRVARAGGGTAAVALPGPGDVRLLRASSDAGRIGYVFTGTSADGAREFSGTLFLSDPSTPDAAPRTVAGLDGSPVRTDAWQFVPGSVYLVAETSDRSLLLVDATGAAPPRVLGQLGDLLSFLPGTTSVVIGGVEGLSILDLTTGAVRPVTGTSSLGAAPGTGRVVLSPDAVATWTPTEVVRGVPGGALSPVAKVDAGARIQEVCASPSGRHLSIGIVPDAAAVDGYPARADRIGRATEVVDAMTGEVVARVEGTRPDWCG